MSEEPELRVEQKWGFGMAPPKPAVQAERHAAAAAVLALLRSDGAAPWPPPDVASVVKGLYSRSFRQDQWDWFTVWRQLGRPGRGFAADAARALAGLRRGLVDEDARVVSEQVAALRRAGGHVHLATFTGRQDDNRQGVGYVYVLSTREQPRLLKIGYTNRPVEERVAEINGATGVAVPFGVRGVWAVADARSVEAELHRRLAPHRVRKDREFFDMEYRDAFRVIRDYVAETREER